MAQFDVYVNPAAKVRAAYPLVVLLQSDVAWDGHGQIVAPLVPKQRIATGAGRLMPVVRVDDADYVVLTHELARVRSRDLTGPRSSAAAARGELLAAIDYLFFGL